MSREFARQFPGAKPWSCRRIRRAGQSMVEYSLVVGMVAVACMGILQVLGNEITSPGTTAINGSVHCIEGTWENGTCFSGFGSTDGGGFRCLGSPVPCYVSLAGGGLLDRVNNAIP